MDDRPTPVAGFLARVRAYDWASYRQLFTPKLVTALQRGYSLEDFRHDAVAGLSVAILALPLSMAIAIGCGVGPDKGLITTVVAGFLISALGGSRYQVGGPAAAFVVIVAQVVGTYGEAGLHTATFLAGVILVAAGLLKLGTYIKYIPGPVIIGFTSGIGIVIAFGQLKDFLGIEGDVPSAFVARIEALYALRDTFNGYAFAVGAGTLAAIFALRRWLPRWPGLLLAVGGASALVWVLSLPVDTIASRFGGIPRSLPAPALPDLSWGMIQQVLPSTFTIAFLIGVESLLSAVAADAMAGTRHRSNMEIVAQGTANLVSPLFQGLPATGVIARTGTNIAASARSPVAGLLHAVFVLLFMVALAPLGGYLVLPALAAVLIATAWRLLELEHLLRFFERAPWDDRVVLAATLALTVFVDLSVAIAVGVVLASMLFMHRMAETPGVEWAGSSPIEDAIDRSQPRSVILTEPLPPGVRAVELRGPLFFGASSRLDLALRELPDWPKVLILRMREVPLVDATGIDTLEQLAREASGRGCRIIMSGLQQQPREALHRNGLLRRHKILVASNSFAALLKAKTMLDKPGAAAPPGDAGRPPADD
jgi:SulP family sulfate permease